MMTFTLFDLPISLFHIFIIQALAHETRLSSDRKHVGGS